MPLPVVLATGTPDKIGADYGYQTTEQIAGNLEEYRRRFRDTAGLEPAAVTRMGEEFRARTIAHTPRIAATLDAVAEAAGIRLGDIYALNARTELLTPMGMKRPIGPWVSGPTECTGVAVLPEYTTMGHTLLGQNWDWYPAQAPYALILATRDERGHEIVTLTEAGMLAKAGLNSAGVGVCVNLLYGDRDGVPGGIPYHVLIRHALDQPDGIAGSLRVTALPRSASINLLIAATGGIAVDLELTPGAVGRVLPEDGLLTHANHFVSAISGSDRFYDQGGSSLFRDFRVRQLLADTAVNRQVSEEDVMMALRDHLGLPSAVCRHVNHMEVEDLRSLTVSSVLMDLDDRRLMFTDGPPCMSTYGTVGLADLFQ